MSVDIKCDNCGDSIDAGDYTHCEKCYKVVCDEVENLKNQVDELSTRNNELHEENCKLTEDLEKANRVIF